MEEKLKDLVYPEQIQDARELEDLVTKLNLAITNCYKTTCPLAHDDFIRKIAVDEDNYRIVTVSDDNKTKLWDYRNGIVMVNRYKDSKHFVMDASFYPIDHNQFLTASLDGKVRLYSVANTKCIRSVKGHGAGINTLEFPGNSIFITGSDDNTAMVWDVKRSMPISV
ncbi:hypothetical protein ACJJTC_004660 [Scirpophaga incertulas]